MVSLFELEIALTLVISETNLDVPATLVLMDLKNFEVPPNGENLRENVKVILTEVA